MNRKLLNEELERKSIEEFKKAQRFPVIVLLDNVRSALNVGSVFRSCDAFMVDKLFLCGFTATPPAKEIYKTSLGSTDSVLWEHHDDTATVVKKLKKQGYVVIAIEQVENKIMLQNFIPEKNKKYAFVFGHEIKGVSQEVVNLCDHCIEIPQWGYKHSINIAVSAGVVLWHTVSQMIK